MENADLFWEVPYVSEHANELLVRAKTAPKSAWIPYYNFMALPLHNDWEVDTWWGKLFEVHPFRAGIIKLEPNTYYDWHVDTDRGAGVNLLLNPSQSHCLFNRDFKRGKSLEQGNVNGSFVELKYKPHTYYIFNSQVAHSVYNFDDTRYLLTVDFKEYKDKLTYNQLLKEFLEARWWEV